MNALWSTADMIEAMAARPLGDLPEAVTGISIDTRTLGAGEVFFAIKGDRFDGHDFVSAAQKAGAALAVISEEKLVALGHLSIPLLVVTDVLEALTRLGVAGRERSRAKIIAVTGSVGKTTTKEMLRTVLAPSGKVHASVASFNNHWGVPLTLARMPHETRFGVFEIGMNHAGEIENLVALVRPHIALITTIAPAHIGNFDNIEGIARAKAEIWTGVVPGGTALVNRDNRFHKLLSELAHEAGIEDVRSIGAKRGSNYWLRSHETGEQGLSVSARLDGRDIEFSFPARGGHMAFNAVAALAVAEIAGADVEKGAAALKRLEAVKGRGQHYRLSTPDGELTLIDESYNANPASVEAALAVLGDTEPGEGGARIAILGDMLELGKTSAQLHGALKEPIEAAAVDRVYLAGPEMAALAKVMDQDRLGGYFDDAEALGEALAGVLGAGDVVMVKASLGSRFGPIVEQVLLEFPLTEGAD